MFMETLFSVMKKTTSASIMWSF